MNAEIQRRRVLNAAGESRKRVSLRANELQVHASTRGHARTWAGPGRCSGGRPQSPSAVPSPSTQATPPGPEPQALDARSAREGVHVQACASATTATPEDAAGGTRVGPPQGAGPHTQEGA